jgi:hypothetical protein
MSGRPDTNLDFLRGMAIHPKFAELFRRMIHPDPNQRYRTAGEILPLLDRAFDLWP